MNATGSWAALATTNFTAPGQAVLVLDGQALVVPSGSGLAPVDSQQMRYLDLDDAGNLAWLARDSATNDWAILVNRTPILRQGDSVDVDGDGTAEAVTGIQALILSGDGSGAVYCVIGAAGFSEVGIQRIQRKPDGSLDARLVVALGSLLPTGETFPLLDNALPNRRREFDSNGTGDLVFSLAGEGVFRYSLASGGLSTVIDVDAPSPLVDKAWTLPVGMAVQLTDAGATYFPGALKGPQSTVDIIAKDEQILLSQEDSFQILGAGSLEAISYQSPIRVYGDNQVLWRGVVARASGQEQDGLFLGHKLVVRTGATKVQGKKIVALTSGQTFMDSMYDMDGTASTLLVRARTEDDLVGLYKIQLKSEVLAIPGCLPKQAQLVPLAPAWNVGEVTLMSLDAPQDANASAFAILSATGAQGCGTLLPGIGELLVDLNAGSLIVGALITSAGLETWIKTPSLPASYAFQGAAVHAQGLWYSPLNPIEPVRFSNALRYTIGL